MFVSKRAVSKLRPSLMIDELGSALSPPSKPFSQKTWSLCRLGSSLLRCVHRLDWIDGHSQIGIGLADGLVSERINLSSIWVDSICFDQQCKHRRLVELFLKHIPCRAVDFIPDRLIGRIHARRADRCHLCIRSLIQHAPKVVVEIPLLMSMNLVDDNQSRKLTFNVSRFRACRMKPRSS